MKAKAILKTGNFILVRKTARRDDKRFVYLVIVPAVLFFAVFFYYPFLANLYYMFTNYNYINVPEFVGLKNINRFFQDSNIGVSFSTTFAITLFGVPVSLVLSLLVALAVFYMTLGKFIIRSAIFSTTLVTGIVAAIIFKLWFGQDLGLVDNILQSLNLSRIPWLTETSWALTGIIILGVWSSLGYNMVIFLAGLSGVNKELSEAAKIDGANSLQGFYNVVLPQLKPTVVFLTITLMINFLKSYASVAILTEGGPYGSTKTVLMYMFQQGFDSRNVGYASVIAFVLFLIIFAITAIQMRLTRFYSE